MSKKHHRIAADVKADILRRVKEEGVSVAQAAQDHGISEGTISPGIKTVSAISCLSRPKAPYRP